MKAGYAPTQALFEKYFQNEVAVLALNQREGFGMTVNLAAKMNLEGLDTGKLMAYTYDPAANIYSLLEEKPGVDASGCLLFEYRGGRAYHYYRQSAGAQINHFLRFFVKALSKIPSPPGEGISFFQGKVV